MCKSLELVREFKRKLKVSVMAIAAGSGEISILRASHGDERAYTEYSCRYVVCNALEYVMLPKHTVCTLSQKVHTTIMWNAWMEIQLLRRLEKDVKTLGAHQRKQ